MKIQIGRKREKERKRGEKNMGEREVRGTWGVRVEKEEI